MRGSGGSNLNLQPLENSTDFQTTLLCSDRRDIWDVSKSREGTIRVCGKWIIIPFYLEIGQPNRAHRTVKCHLSSNGSNRRVTNSLIPVRAGRASSLYRGRWRGVMMMSAAAAS